MSTSFVIYAHRGAAKLYPENTLPAFIHAIQTGANGVELDVQLSQDGHPVVIHDFMLDRTTDGSGPVRQYSLQQLKKLSAGGWFNHKYRSCQIPALDEVLKALHPYPVQINIELKNFLHSMPDIEKSVIELIQKHEMEQRTVISTFNVHSLKLIKHLNTQIQTALIYLGNMDRPWLAAYELQANYLHPPVAAITPALIEQSRRLGIGVCPYIVNDPTMMRKIRNMGAKGMITEFPQKARRVLNSRHNRK